MEMTEETRAMFAEAAGHAVRRATEAGEAVMGQGGTAEDAAGVFMATVERHRMEFAAAVTRAVYGVTV